jgi:hypothetical protein
MKAFRGWAQGYNAQTAVNEHQIALAAEITTETIDFGQLAPMLNATTRERDSAGVGHRPAVVLADAGYWNEQHMDDTTAEHGLRVLIPPDSSRRKGERPGWSARYSFMRRVLDTDAGSRLYRQRKSTVEPVFAHTKHNRHIDRFHRRGRTAVRTEWRLILMTHNSPSSTTTCTSPPQPPEAAKPARRRFSQPSITELPRGFCDGLTNLRPPRRAESAFAPLLL